MPTSPTLRGWRSQCSTHSAGISSFFNVQRTRTLAVVLRNAGLVRPVRRRRRRCWWNDQRSIPGSSPPDECSQSWGRPRSFVTQRKKHQSLQKKARICDRCCVECRVFRAGNSGSFEVGFVLWALCCLFHLFLTNPTLISAYQTSPLWWVDVLCLSADTVS